MIAGELRSLATMKNEPINYENIMTEYSLPEWKLFYKWNSLHSSVVMCNKFKHKLLLPAMIVYTSK